jgi:hypothetical protein
MRQEVLRMLTLRTLAGRAATQDKEVAIEAARSIDLTVTELLHERLLIKVGLIPENEPSTDTEARLGDQAKRLV